MRLYEINQELPTQQEYEEMAAKIKRRCSHILSVYQKTSRIFYRGFSKKMPMFFSGKPHKNRKTLSSRPELQTVFDLALDQLGARAKRSNSIFVTSNWPDAEGYGDIYIIFPVDGFDFTYSETEADVILKRPKILNEIFNYLPVAKMLVDRLDQKLAEGDVNADDFLQKFLKKVYPWHTQDNFIEYSFRASINPEERGILIAEILSLFDSAPDLAKRLIGITKEDLYNQLIDLDKFQSHLEINYTDLEGALKSEHEVYIRGAYYAIRRQKAGELMKILGMDEFY